MKGYRVGGCLVSTVHANFIVNEGSACAHDIERLIRHIQATVFVASGVALEPEVLVVGESAEVSP